MTDILMFMMSTCPYCKKAEKYMAELLKQPEYAGLQIARVDENKEPEVADMYDYFYVPTYYVGGQKVFEGAATMDDVKRVFDLAIEAKSMK